MVLRLQVSKLIMGLRINNMTHGDKIKFIIGLILINIISALFVGFLYNNYVSKKRCSDFRSQDEAQEAYVNGALQLDGDNDSWACENL